MKKLIDTLKNIWNIEDLRNRILFTLGLILIYRVGSHIVLPGIDGAAIQTATENQGGLLGLLNMFVGGAFNRASIFALGIMPYISASIALQLFTLVVPHFQRMAKEGESGRKKINNYTRFGTILISFIQSIAYVTYLKNAYPSAIMDIPQGLFIFSTIVCLIAGTIFVMWLGERITDRGIGNGISLIITTGIIARFPQALFQEGASRISSLGGPLVFILELALLLIVVLAIILLVQGTRRIPIQYAKRMVGNKQYMGGRNFLPVKVNTAGVMPIIFAQALMFIPSLFGQFFPNSSFMQSLQQGNIVTTWWYNIVFAILIIIFSYLYTALIINPIQMSEEMKRNGGFIPGIKPGRKTAEFIDGVISRITLPGAIFLALVAIMPAFASATGVSQGFANFFGGTSILIMVGTVLDTLQQIENELLTRQYDGLMKSGRIKGRNISPVTIAQG